MPFSPFGDADAQAVLDGLGGVSVTVGGTTANGVRRSTDEPLNVQDQTGQLGARQDSVLVRTTTFGAIVPQGTAITVDGTAYKVITSVREASGLFTRIYFATP